jgi:BolA protein
MINTNSTNLISLVKSRLEQHLSPTMLEIADESKMHAGHTGAQNGMSHLAVTISSKTLERMPKLLAHKAIYSALDEFMNTRIHALRIRIIKTD